MAQTEHSRRIKHWRAFHKLTQAQAARIVGVDENTWYRWEAAQRDVNNTALRLIIALDLLWKYEPKALRDGIAARVIDE